ALRLQPGAARGRQRPRREPIGAGSCAARARARAALGLSRSGRPAPRAGRTRADPGQRPQRAARRAERGAHQPPADRSGSRGAQLRERPRSAPRASLRVRLASPLEAEWLLDHAPEGLSEKQELSWDDTKERAVLTSQ